MSNNNTPPSDSGPLQPDAAVITKEEVLTQFAVIKAKDGRIVVQFPVLDMTTQEVDIPMAMELAGAGFQTLARVVRQQQKKEPGRITLVPAMPGLKGD